MSEPIPIAKGDFEAALGARFRSVRESRDAKLKDLAVHLGLSVNTIRWHEAGAVMLRLDMLHKAAEFLGCEVNDLTIPESEATNGN
jgi:transcriptional regulator with XRE-family HTH domain